jgi:hypothetical protein
MIIWYPDNCGSGDDVCAIELENMRFIRFRKKCRIHTKYGYDFDKIYSENIERMRMAEKISQTFKIDVLQVLSDSAFEDTPNGRKMVFKIPNTASDIDINMVLSDKPAEFNVELRKPAKNTSFADRI